MEAKIAAARSVRDGPRFNTAPEHILRRARFLTRRRRRARATGAEAWKPGYQARLQSRPRRTQRALSRDALAARPCRHASSEVQAAQARVAVEPTAYLRPTPPDWWGRTTIGQSQPPAHQRRRVSG